MSEKNHPIAMVSMCEKRMQCQKKIRIQSKEIVGSWQQQWQFSVEFISITIDLIKHIQFNAISFKPYFPSIQNFEKKNLYRGFGFQLHTRKNCVIRDEMEI